MSFEIPVANEDGVEVARVVWDGELYQGSARVDAIVGHEKVAANLRAMILERDDLKELRFRSEGTEYWIRGWRGYEGVVGALRILLPSLGLRIGHIGGNTPALGAQRRDEIAFNFDEGGIE